MICDSAVDDVVVSVADEDEEESGEDGAGEAVTVLVEEGAIVPVVPEIEIALVEARETGGVGDGDGIIVVVTAGVDMVSVVVVTAGLGIVAGVVNRIDGSDVVVDAIRVHSSQVHNAAMFETAPEQSCENEEVVVRSRSLSRHRCLAYEAIGVRRCLQNAVIRDVRKVCEVGLVLGATSRRTICWTLCS